MANQTYVNADGIVLALTSTATSPLTTVWGATGANQTLYGNTGNDNFAIFDPTDKIVIPATHGIYTITDSAWGVAYNLQAGINNLIVNGDLQLVSGNALSNLIETGAYRTTVSGGGGDDVFVLSTGAVTVVDPQGSGNDVIYGFNTSIDHVSLSGSTVFTSWSSIQSALTQSGSDVVLNMGNGQTLTFRNMNVSAFSSSDFNYPIPTSIMRETFDDEFNSFVSSSNGSVGWMTSWPYGGVNSRAFPGGQDSAYYSDSSTGYNPFKIVNGVLDLTATTAAAAGGNADNLPYESGVLTTYKSESQLYGYFEIKAQLPTGQGLWPAFYMQSYDGTAELDIFEILGKSPTELFPTATDHATGASTTQEITIPNSSTAFHTYGVDWEPNTVTFYMDGNIIASAPTPASMHQPMYMVIGLGVGSQGSWTGAPTSNSVFPATMQIDYVRAYATAATQDVSGTAAITQTSTQTPLSVTESVSAVTSANGAAVRPFNGVTITDAANQTETATVTLNSTANGTLSDPYAAADGSKITNGVWTMTGTASAVATGLYNLVFTPSSSQTAASVATTVTAAIKDTAGTTASMSSTITATKTVTVTPLSVTESVSAVTSANGAAARPFNGVTITDAANQTETATVTLSSTANGTLSDPYAAADGSKITSGVWTMTGTASAVATGLYNLMFTPSSSQTAASVATTVTAAIKDTAGNTASMSSTITATKTVTTSTPAPDTLTLRVSETTANTDAQFTVSVNGNQVGGVYTADVFHSSGDANTISLTGDWNSGINDVAISFINDGAGRDLYVNSIAYNGTTYAGTSAALLTNGTDTFAVGGSTATAAAPADSLTLNLSEDQYLGVNALFNLYIDGKIVTNPQQVTALHANNATQSFTFTGDFGAGTHTIGVGFVNDGYGGSPSLDRNLYINGVSFNGATVFSGIDKQGTIGVTNFTVTASH